MENIVLMLENLEREEPIKWKINKKKVAIVLGIIFIIFSLIYK